MHSVIDAFNCCFVFLGSSLDHIRKILTFVRAVVRLTKAQARTTPSLQLEELRKRVFGVSPPCTPSPDLTIG